MANPVLASDIGEQDTRKFEKESVFRETVEMDDMFDCGRFLSGCKCGLIVAMLQLRLI